MVTLRTKTTKVLNEELCKILTDIIENFTQRKDGDEVEEYIWRLTYIPDETARHMGFPEGLHTGDIRTIRNEISSQFRTIQKGWIYGKEEVFGEKYSDNTAYEELRKALDDPYALHVIVRKCEAYMHLDIEAISKTIGCLKSTWPTSHYKGFQERLAFSEEEQKYFMKARKEIAAFLESLCSERLEEYRREYREAEEARTATKQNQRVHEEAIVESQTETKEVISMTAQEILSQREKIEAFFKACDTVKDPVWLIENREKIEKLLEASDQF